MAEFFGLGEYGYEKIGFLEDQFWDANINLEEKFAINQLQLRIHINDKVIKLGADTDLVFDTYRRHADVIDIRNYNSYIIIIFELSTSQDPFGEFFCYSINNNKLEYICQIIEANYYIYLNDQYIHSLMKNDYDIYYALLDNSLKLILNSVPLEDFNGNAMTKRYLPSVLNRIAIDINVVGNIAILESELYVNPLKTKIYLYENQDYRELIRKMHSYKFMKYYFSLLPKDIIDLMIKYFPIYDKKLTYGGRLMEPVKMPCLKTIFPELDMTSKPPPQL